MQFISSAFAQKSFKISLYKFAEHVTDNVQKRRICPGQCLISQFTTGKKNVIVFLITFFILHSDLFKKTLNNDKLTVKVESLKDADVASILTLSEQGRRMQDMMKMYAAGGMGGMDPNMFAADQTLTLNANNALVKYLFEHKDSEHSGMFAEQLYDLAMLSNQPLSAEAMTKFVKRSNDIMLLLTK